MVLMTRSAPSANDFHVEHRRWRWAGLQRHHQMGILTVDDHFSTTEPAPGLPHVFHTVNQAILARAQADSDTVDYLLVAKLAMVRHHHSRGEDR